MLQQLYAITRVTVRMKWDYVWNKQSPRAVGTGQGASQANPPAQRLVGPAAIQAKNQSYAQGSCINKLLLSLVNCWSHKCWNSQISRVMLWSFKYKLSFRNNLPSSFHIPFGVWDIDIRQGSSTDQANRKEFSAASLREWSETLQTCVLPVHPAIENVTQHFGRTPHSTQPEWAFFLTQPAMYPASQPPTYSAIYLTTHPHLPIQPNISKHIFCKELLMNQQAVGTPSKLTGFLKDKMLSSLSLPGLGLKVTKVCSSKL